MFDLENFPTRELARDMMGMISPFMTTHMWENGFSRL